LETVIGAVPGAGGYIPISVTVSGQTNISSLSPTITYTGASITPPGGAPQTTKPFEDSVRNFGSPQADRVTAEDGSYKDYEVSVHVSGGGAKIITGFVFEPEDNAALTVAAVGQINQDTHTIEVRVPHSVDLTSLKPTITYLGKSAGFAGTVSGTPPMDTNTVSAGQNGNTNTDTARDFSASAPTPLIYTVTMADDSPDNTQEYTVKVINIPEVTISYGSLRDDKFTTERFDQSTGLLTITINTSDTFGSAPNDYTYKASFDWYVDGVDQPVSDTQESLTIKTAGFGPGRHQITVSAMRSSDNRHYTNVLYFDVTE
jgi:hypothetical protein